MRAPFALLPSAAAHFDIEPHTNMSENALRVLKLFNEKVERLEQLSFTAFVRENRLGFSVVTRDGEPPRVEVRGPSSEATDAFVLTLRLFVQDNEAISIRRTGELYESLPVSSTLRAQYREARTILNEFLDRSSNVTLGSDTMTLRRIFDTFLYGGLAHANRAKKAEFDSWGTQPMLFGVLQTFFHSVLVELLRFLLWSHEQNLLTIAELEAGER